MKRIAIFCDGTWNRSDAEHPTNVVRLAQAVCRRSSDGIAQLVIYVEGVGAGRGSSTLSRAFDRLGGGAFGWGLTENIVEAYRHLAFNHEPGDEIFLFGFSRGAYTARSLAGLMRSCGVPSVENIPRIPEALARYRDRDARTHPKTEESMRFRAGFSPVLATQAEEVPWREAEGQGSCQLLSLRYLGVWDTVGALGVPGHYRLLARLLNRRHEFHDTQLSRLVASARHAVAIDERRRTFPPTLWTSASDEVGDRRQEWFPGDHAAVGGGGDVRGLSNAALAWIAEGAEAAGLRLASGAIDGFRDETDLSVDVRGRSRPRSAVSWLVALGEADRSGPADRAEVSECAAAKWALDAEPPYRPRPLLKVMR